MPDAAALVHADLGGDAFLEAFDVADDADHLAAGVEGVERGEGGFEGVAVEGAEAFIEEERIDRGFVADQIGERQRQRQADEEALATGQGARVAGGVALPAVDDVQRQFALLVAQPA